MAGIIRLSSLKCGFRRSGSCLLSLVADDMRQRVLRYLAWEVCLVAGPITERATEAVYRGICHADAIPASRTPPHRIMAGPGAGLRTGTRRGHFAIMTGDGDQVIHPEEGRGDKLRRAIPHGTLQILHGIGHMIHHVATQEVVDAIEEVARKSTSADVLPSPILWFGPIYFGSH